MEISLFQDLLVILFLSIGVILIGHRLRIPPVVGFLITGVLCGPHALGIVHDVEDVEMIAQIGILLLLFGIGMEFSIKKLVEIKRLFLVGGSLQVGLTLFFGYLVGYFFNRSWEESIVLGCLLSLSSTAIVLRFLEQRGEFMSPQGRLSVTILIFQDLIAIPMILLIPLLSMQKTDAASFDPTMVWMMLKGIVSLVLVFFCAEWVVPRILLQVARTRNKELFLLSVLALCFGVAWLTSHLGLSLTIGAFLAGLIVSESEYSNEAIGNILPFQALFISFFFVSIGMLLDVHFLLAKPILILGLTLAVMIIKIITGGLTTLALGLPIRIAILVGIALCQIGEFSFVLAKIAVPLGIGSDYYYQLFLAVSLMTMGLSPILMGFSSPIADFVSKLPLPKKLLLGFSESVNEPKADIKNHIVIIGFGISGKNMARSSKVAGIPYVILEVNPDTVKEYKKKGEPIHFGDATHLSILQHMHIQDAKAAAVLINDPAAARRIVQIIREVNPSIYLIVRTRYVEEMKLMKSLGADEAIPDEFGTSVEIFSRVLKQYHVPQEDIEKVVGDIRAEGYDIIRNPTPTRLGDVKMNLHNIEINSFRVHPDSTLVGQTLSNSKLRELYGMNVVLIRRNNEMLTNPSPDHHFSSNDIVVVVGEKMQLKKAQALFGLS